MTLHVTKTEHPIGGICGWEGGFVGGVGVWGWGGGLDTPLYIYSLDMKFTKVVTTIA